MSSSRSIAAARNRRSGDVSGSKKTAQPGRPVQSIGGQQIINNKFTPSTMNQNMSSKNTSTSSMPFSKLSVSDAIGLITLRLGKVEQYMYDSMENGNNISSGVAVSNNKTLIDQSVLNTMISRIDTLEKKQLEKSPELKINEMNNKVNTFEQSLTEFRATIQQFIEITNDKIIDIENAFVEIEKNIESDKQDSCEVDDEGQVDSDNKEDVKEDDEEDDKEKESDKEEESEDNDENVEGNIQMSVDES